MTRIELPTIDVSRWSAASRQPGGRPPREKFDALLSVLREPVAQGALVTFSGGVDSAFLLWASMRATEHGGRVAALTTVSASTPGPDLEDARTFAAAVGVDHICVPSHELDSEEYARNDPDRCYHCKTDLFRIASRVAREQGLSWILYGYTATDRHDVRPGHRAAGENGVLAPLSDVGLEKAEIRALMREHGLELADKPGSPCLSSRIATGIPVDRARLADIAAMEAILRRRGLTVYRARICASGSSHFFRIEVEPAEMHRVLACRSELEEEGRARGYRWVTLDLGGYRTGGGGA